MTQPQDSTSDSSRPDDAEGLRTYEKPELSVYGNVKEITEEILEGTADLNQGGSNNLG